MDQTNNSVDEVEDDLSFYLDRIAELAANQIARNMSLPGDGTADNSKKANDNANTIAEELATANAHLLNQDNSVTAMFPTMATSLSLQNAMQGICTFTGDSGYSIPLKDFLQDVKNGQNYITPLQEGHYVKAVLGKLK